MLSAAGGISGECWSPVSAVRIGFIRSVQIVISSANRPSANRLLFVRVLKVKLATDRLLLVSRVL